MAPNPYVEEEATADDDDHQCCVPLTNDVMKSASKVIFPYCELRPPGVKSRTRLTLYKRQSNGRESR